MPVEDFNCLWLAAAAAAAMVKKSSGKVVVVHRRGKQEIPGENSTILLSEKGDETNYCMI